MKKSIYDFLQLSRRLINFFLELFSQLMNKDRTIRDLKSRKNGGKMGLKSGQKGTFTGLIHNLSGTLKLNFIDIVIQYNLFYLRNELKQIIFKYSIVCNAIFWRLSDKISLYLENERSMSVETKGANFVNDLNS